MPRETWAGAGLSKLSARAAWVSWSLAWTWAELDSCLELGPRPRIIWCRIKCRVNWAVRSHQRPAPGPDLLDCPRLTSHGRWETRREERHGSLVTREICQPGAENAAASLHPAGRNLCSELSFLNTGSLWCCLSERLGMRIKREQWLILWKANTYHAWCWLNYPLSVS